VIVASCKNGTDTLEALRKLKPDLAIVDLKMPGLTGIEVLTEIRKENQFTIFIILTLYSTLYYRQLAMEAGADYFFSKADDFDNIAGVVEEMVREEYREKGIKTADR
jgi:DNA-binding NarL/FixJ family response regulator